MAAKAVAIVSNWPVRARRALTALSILTLLVLANCEAEPVAMAARVITG